jgi:hypothetical protein
VCHGPNVGDGSTPSLPIATEPVWRIVQILRILSQCRVRVCSQLGLSEVAETFAAIVLEWIWGLFPDFDLI